ncbi:glycosyltransferase [Anabaena sp. CS-542/02]|nr:glycosyltransferase [Anabaena sp. CS-542/02]MDB9446459.1 glycosyltransferase [Anabaena sp. CS-542/02]
MGIRRSPCSSVGAIAFAALGRSACSSVGAIASNPWLFSAADLFIFPTRADNLSLVLQDSMACGTPMVSFKIGGVPDLVCPGITGYLAQPENTQDFSDRIFQLLKDDQLRKTMSENCRAIAINENYLDLQVTRYIEPDQQVYKK